MAHEHWVLTGGTGIIGRELLPRLVRGHPERRITLLVRGGEAGRVGQARDELFRYVRHYYPDLDLRGVQVVRGDVTRPRLGLTRSRFDLLGATTTHIVHAAARIALTPPLRAARKVNLGGTCRLLSFAERCPRLVRFGHVSTAYVAGDRRGLVTEGELQRGQRFRNPYERSKLEAELVVRRSMDRLPITVFRPSIVVGHSADGRISCFKNLYVPLRFMVSGRMGELPGERGATLDLVPVDHVAGAIADLMDDPRAVGRTYHLTAGPENTVTAGWFHSTLIRLWGAGGRSLRADAAPRSARARRILERLAPFLGYLTGRTTFDDAGLRRHLAPDRRAPHPAEFLPAVLEFCRATDWGARLPWIAGRLAVSPGSGAYLSS
jgi:long-chain acyl-CoA synthetase